jgi:hypothetical protein
MNWKNVGKTLLLVIGGAAVNYLLTIVPGLHFSATYDPVITGVATLGLHALQEWIVSQSATTNS